MQSIYRWQSRVVVGREAVVIVKARQALGDAVAVFVRARHTYECPRIATLPALGGEPARLDWIAESSLPCQDAG